MCVDRRSRAEKLGRFVDHAKRILALARPATTYVCRVLEKLTDQEVGELGKWDLDKTRTERIIDRLTAQLEVHRWQVEAALGGCLRNDLWTDHAEYYPTWEQRYRDSGYQESTFEKLLGVPPRVYCFVGGVIVCNWRPEPVDFSMSLIEDDRWAVICMGYLVTQHRAFATTLELLEATIRQEWRNWQRLWSWF